MSKKNLLLSFSALSLNVLSSKAFMPGDISCFSPSMSIETTISVNKIALENAQRIGQEFEENQRTIALAKKYLKDAQEKAIAKYGKEPGFSGVTDRIITDKDGNKFLYVNMKGDGDCCFHSLGVSRTELVNRLEAYIRTNNDSEIDKNTLEKSTNVKDSLESYLQNEIPKKSYDLLLTNFQSLFKKIEELFTHLHKTGTEKPQIDIEKNIKILENYQSDFNIKWVALKAKKDEFIAAISKLNYLSESTKKELKSSFNIKPNFDLSAFVKKLTTTINKSTITDPQKAEALSTINSAKEPFEKALSDVNAAYNSIQWDEWERELKAILSALNAETKIFNDMSAYNKFIKSVGKSLEGKLTIAETEKINKFFEETDNLDKKDAGDTPIKLGVREDFEAIDYSYTFSDLAVYKDTLIEKVVKPLYEKGLLNSAKSEVDKKEKAENEQKKLNKEIALSYDTPEKKEAAIKQELENKLSLKANSLIETYNRIAKFNAATTDEKINIIKEFFGAAPNKREWLDPSIVIPIADKLNLKVAIYKTYGGVLTKFDQSPNADEPGSPELRRIYHTGGHYDLLMLIDDEKKQESVQE